MYASVPFSAHRSAASAAAAGSSSTIHTAAAPIGADCSGSSDVMVAVSTVPGGGHARGVPARSPIPSGGYAPHFEASHHHRARWGRGGRQRSPDRGPVDDQHG